MSSVESGTNLGPSCSARRFAPARPVALSLTDLAGYWDRPHEPRQGSTTTPQDFVSQPGSRILHAPQIEGDRRPVVSLFRVVDMGPAQPEDAPAAAVFWSEFKCVSGLRKPHGAPARAPRIGWASATVWLHDTLTTYWTPTPATIQAHFAEIAVRLDPKSSERMSLALGPAQPGPFQIPDQDLAMLPITRSAPIATGAPEVEGCPAACRSPAPTESRSHDDAAPRSIAPRPCPQ